MKGGAGGSTSGTGATGGTIVLPALRVYVGSTGSKETTVEIGTALALGNGGTTNVDLSTVSLRYYFTTDGCPLANLIARCDLSLNNQRPTACPVARFVPMANPKPTANAYLELTLSGAGALGSAAAYSYQESGAIFDPSYACTFRQSNDYSYSQKISKFTLTSTITAYVNGTLAWGKEP